MLKQTERVYAVDHVRLCSKVCMRNMCVKWSEIGIVRGKIGSGWLVLKAIFALNRLDHSRYQFHSMGFFVFGMRETKVRRKREEDIPISRRQTMTVASLERERERKGGGGMHSIPLSY